MKTSLSWILDYVDVPAGTTVEHLTDRLTLTGLKLEGLTSPGADVRHEEHGAGWVWGSGLGRVTVRFEGPTTGPGPVRTFRSDDPHLSSADPPDWS